MTDKNKSPDLSNEAEVKAIKEKSKSAEDTHSEDIKWLMNDARGRRIMWRNISMCHVFATSFTTNLSQTNFNEGERNIGLQLLNEVMDHSPEKYIKMMEENKS